MALSEYELKREQNIRQNKETLRLLGLEPTSEVLPKMFTTRGVQKKKKVGVNLYSFVDRRKLPHRIARPRPGECRDTHIKTRLIVRVERHIITDRGSVGDHDDASVMDDDDDVSVMEWCDEWCEEESCGGLPSSSLPSSLEDDSNNREPPKDISKLEETLALDSPTCPELFGDQDTCPWSLIPTSSGILSCKGKFVVCGDLPDALLDFLEIDLEQLYDAQKSADTGDMRYRQVYRSAGGNHTRGCFLGWTPNWIEHNRPVSLGKVVDSKLGAVMVAAALRDPRLRSRDAVRGWTMYMIEKGEDAARKWIEEV